MIKLDLTVLNENTLEFDDDLSTDDNGFVVSAIKDLSGESGSTFFQPNTIEKSSQIIYPYEKKGYCSKLIIPKLTFFDPSGNSGGKISRDIKKFFPMSKLSKFELSQNPSGCTHSL